MGNINSCQNVGLGENRICDIGGCTQSVSGIKSNSASPTDIWMLTLYNGTRYGNIIVNGEVVLKIFISDSTNSYISQSPELVYESQIYEFIVGSMFAKYINPHFVPYYGRALGCTIDNLADILKNNEPDKTIREEAIYYNSYYYARNRLESGRPSINKTISDINNNRPIPIDIREGIKNIKSVKDDFRYGMMVTAKSNGITFDKFFRTMNMRDKSNKSKIKSYYIHPTRDTMIIIVQILSALCSLVAFECAHNDLHMGNIFVNEKHPNELPFIYKFTDGFSYSFEPNYKYIAALYDWDRSYSPLLGDNPKNNDKRCKNNMNCNEFISKRDILKILTYIIKIVGSGKFRDDMVDLIWTTKESKKKYIDEVINGPGAYFLRLKSTGDTMEKKDFDDMYEPTDILSKMICYCNVIFPDTIKIHKVLPKQTTPHSYILYDFTYSRVYNDRQNFITNSQYELMRQQQPIRRTRRPLISRQQPQQNTTRRNKKDLKLIIENVNSRPYVYKRFNDIIKTFEFYKHFSTKEFIEFVKKKISEGITEDYEIYKLFRQTLKNNPKIDNKRGLQMGKKVKNILKSFVPETYLDYGCGDGEFTLSIKNMYNLKRENVYCADIEKYKSITDNKLQFKLIKDNKPLDVQDNMFDLITVFMVMHHIKDNQQEKTIRDLYRMLKPGGRLLLREHDAPVGNSRVTFEEFSKVIDILHDVYDYVLESEMTWDEDKYFSKYRTLKEWDRMFQINGFTLGKLSYNTNPNFNPQSKYERVYIKNKPIMGGVIIKNSYINQPRKTSNKMSSFELI